MKNEIDIKYRTIEIPSKITYKGEDLPINKWNIGVVNEYKRTGDKSVLERLTSITLEL